MPPITLIIEPNPTRDNVRRTGPAAAAGHVGRDPVDASDSRSPACPETRSPSYEAGRTVGQDAGGVSAGCHCAGKALWQQITRPADRGGSPPLPAGGTREERARNL